MQALRGGRPAGVSADADLRIDFDLAEEWHFEGLSHPLAFADRKFRIYLDRIDEC